MRSQNPRPEDEQRLTDWVHQFSRPLFGFVLAMTGKADLAEDLTQEVFQRAWQARERYEEKGEARAYLFRIADRLIKDWRRKKKGETTVSDESWVLLEPGGEEHAASAAAISREENSRLAAAMRQLTDAQRRVLLMRYFGNLDFSQIALITDSPINTVLSHCRRGLLAMKKLMAEESP